MRAGKGKMKEKIEMKKEVNKTKTRTKLNKAKKEKANAVEKAEVKKKYQALLKKLTTYEVPQLDTCLSPPQAQEETDYVSVYGGSVLVGAFEGGV